MRVTLLLLSIAVTPLATAQSFLDNYSKFTVGGGISANVYQGDLTKRRMGSIETIKPGIALWGAYAINKKLSAQLSTAVLRLKGDDSKYDNPSYRRLRNFKFTTSVTEIEAKIQYSIFTNNEKDFRLLFPYISTGVGFGFYNVRPDASGLTSKLANDEPWIVAGLAQDAINGTPTNLIYIPLIIGAKKYFTPRIDLYAEANYRFVNSDYIDGFSQAAGKNNKDKYYGITVGAIYKFNKQNASKMGCPTW